MFLLWREQQQRKQKTPRQTKPAANPQTLCNGSQELLPWRAATQNNMIRYEIMLIQIKLAWGSAKRASRLPLAPRNTPRQAAQVTAAPPAHAWTELTLAKRHDNSTPDSAKQWQSVMRPHTPRNEDQKAFAKRWTPQNNMTPCEFMLRGQCMPEVSAGQTCGFLPAASHSIPKRNRMRLYAFSFIPGWDARDTLTSATGYVYSCIPG